MLTITIDGIDQTYRVELGDGIGSLLTMADHGEVGTGQILIDDPDGDLTFNGWREAYVEEDECIAQPRIWTGYVFIRTMSRSRDSFRTGAARLIACDINDLNATAGLKAWTTDDAKRPYEGEDTRMAALLASECCAGLIYDNGLVNVGTGFADEADFRRQFAGEVLASMAYTSKNWYIYRDHDYGQASLFWDEPDAAVRLCTLRISNVIGDQDGDTLYPYRDAELTRDPSEVYSRYWIEYDSGAVVMGTNLTTETTYIDRDGGYTSTRIGREATAQAQLAIELDIHSTEQDRITTTVFVPAAQLGLIEAGMLLDVRFTHLPGYETFTPQRIVSCDVQRFNASEEAYEVRLELSLAKRAGSPGGGNPGDFPHNDPPGVNDEVEVWIYTLNTPLSNHQPKYSASNFGDPTKSISPYYWMQNGIEIATSGGSFISADSTNGDGTGLFALPGAAFLHATIQYNVPVYLDAMYNGAGGLGYTNGLGEFEWWDDPGGAPGPQPAGMTITSYNVTAGSGGPGEVLRSGYFIVTDPAHPPASTPPPLPGQWVYGETPTPAVDGSTTAFSTAYAFATGSLRVYVDLLDQTDAVTAQDGAAGTFTLGFAPQVGEALTVDYQGR